jgi:MFS family permease
MAWSRRAHPHWIFAALAVAGLSYAISQTMLLPSLPDIEETFGATPSEVTTLMTAFWVSGAVTAGIFGRLGDMFGKRRMIFAVMACFCTGALVSAVAPTLLVMVGGRVLMGCGIGLFPLAYSLMRDELPPRRVASSIALMAGLIAGGAAVGQSTGGLVSDAFGFRAIFWIALGLGILSIGAILALVPESHERTGGAIDVRGAALFALGIAAPLIAIAEAPAWGWGATQTLILIAAGLVLLGLFVRHEVRTDEPLIDIPTLLLPRIRLTNAATLFVGFGFFGFSTILTQFFQEPTSTGYGPGADATQAGLYLAPGLVILAIASPFAGALSNRVGPVFTFRLGIAICTLGIAAMTVSHAHTFELYLWPAVMYLGTGATFGAMPTIILQSVPPERSGQSSAINMIIRTTGSAVGVQLAATLITASIAANGAPTDRGYTAAFALATAAGVVALAIAMVIPRRLAPASAPAPGRRLEPVTTASPPA